MKRHHSITLCLALLIIHALPSRGWGQEWTRFRGPNGTGHGQAKHLPVQWTESDFNWKLELPGSGHSSPVLWGDRIFLTATPGEGTQGGLIILCVSAAEGRILWQQPYELPVHQKHRFNSYASSTPAVDGDRVYVTWTSPDHHMLLALDHDGKESWRKDLGSYASEHGGGASPMIHGGKLYLGNEQDGASFVIAINPVDGATLWQTPREPARTAYATPCLYQPEAGPAQLIFTSQAHGIYAIHPDNGKVLWEYKEAFDKRSVSSPVVAAGKIIGSCGSGGGGNYVVAITPPGANRPSPELAYEVRRSAPYVPTSVAVGDLLFLWSDTGIVSCVHAPTGEIKWQERVGGDYFASPIHVDGRLYGISTSGEVVVVEASETFKVLGRNPLHETSHSTPAVANGRLYLRTLRHLYSVGGSSS